MAKTLSPNLVAAHAVVRRNAEERRAQWLRARQWVCVPPERLTPQLRAQLAELNMDRPLPGGAPGTPPQMPAESPA